MQEIPGDLTGPDFVAILESLASGVSIANAEGRIIFSNSAANRILGKTRTDAPASEWASHYGVFIPGTDTPFPDTGYPLVRALNGEEVDDVEMLIRNPSRPHDVTVRSSALSPSKTKGQVSPRNSANGSSTSTRSWSVA